MKKIIDAPTSSRKKYVVRLAQRTEPTEYVPRIANNIGEMLCRQQMQGVDTCTSHTIPTQSDDDFGSPGVLGNICADRHMLLQDYLDSATAQSNDTIPN